MDSTPPPLPGDNFPPASAPAARKQISIVWVALGAFALVVALTTVACILSPWIARGRPGAAVVLHFDLSDLGSADPDSRWQRTLKSVASRAERLGGGVVSEIAPGLVRVRFPGTQAADLGAAAAVLTKPGRLELRIVHRDYRNLRAPLPPGALPPDFAMLPLVSRDADGTDQTTYFAVRCIPEQTGDDIAEAYPSMNMYGSFEILIRFTETGARRFETVTGQHIGDLLAIVVDGQLYSAPRINERIRGGSAQITGNFSQREAIELANTLESPLPLPVTFTLENADGTPAVD